MDGAVVISLAGELDMSTAAALESRLAGVVQSCSAPAIVLDFSDVRFVDARCAGVIADAWATARGRGRVLRVDGLEGMPARVFALLGLGSIVGGDPGDR